MAEYFNQREVLEHLGLTDYRVLKNWCKEATPEIKPRRRKGFGPGPSLWYTGTQVRKLEKIAEAHARAARRSETTEKTSSEENTEPALLSPEENTEPALLSSLLARLEVLEGKVDGLELPEGETLASFIQKEVKRQVHARTRVAKVSMQSSEGVHDAHRTE